MVPNSHSKNMGWGGGLFHSHVQTSPLGSTQQMICYHYKDDNNHWFVLPPWDQPKYNPNDPQILYLLRHPRMPSGFFPHLTRHDGAADASHAAHPLRLPSLAPVLSLLLPVPSLLSPSLHILKTDVPASKAVIKEKEDAKIDGAVQIAISVNKEVDFSIKTCVGRHELRVDTPSR